MEDLHFQGEEKLPEVNFGAQSGSLVIKGRCIPEDSVGFFDPLFKWVDDYSTAAQPETTVDVYLDYFNTSASKLILELFEKVKAIQDAGSTQVKIIWRYEEYDNDLLEAGEDYSAIVGIPFEIIQMSED